jgi:hypothetical protein
MVAAQQSLLAVVLVVVQASAITPALLVPMYIMQTNSDTCRITIKAPTHVGYKVECHVKVIVRLPNGNTASAAWYTRVAVFIAHCRHFLMGHMELFPHVVPLCCVSGS